MEEARLIELLQARDQDAFKVLFDRTFRKLRYLSYRIVRDRDEATDIAQESLAVLWKNAPVFSSLNEVEGYLYAVARNASHKYLAKQKAKRNYLAEAVHGSKSDEALLAEKALYELEMLEALYLEIEKLPHQCRQVVKLHYINRIPKREVAEQLQISEATVRRHCSIAREKLRQIFRDEKELLYFLLLAGIIQS